MRNPWAGEEEGSSGNTNTSGGSNKMEEPWAGLSERSLVVMVEQLFSHLLKVLNICAHVLDDTPPGPAVKVMSLCVVAKSDLFVNHIFLASFNHRKAILLILNFVPYMLGHPPLPKQHPLPQSHPEKRQREGGC